jgi:hypothetical protein
MALKSSLPDTVLLRTMNVAATHSGNTMHETCIKEDESYDIFLQHSRTSFAFQPNAILMGNNFSLISGL